MLLTLPTRYVTALDPLNLRMLAKERHVTACPGTLLWILGVNERFVVLWLTLVVVVEHKLKRLIIRLITAHVEIVIVEIPTARLVNISDVSGLVASIQFVRVLRVWIYFEALTLHNLPPLQDLVCSWIGSYGPFFDRAAWSRIKLVPIIRRQFRPALQDVVALVVVADVHLALMVVLLHRMLRYGVPRREQTRLVHLLLRVISRFSAVHQLWRRVVRLDAVVDAWAILNPQLLIHHGDVFLLGVLGYVGVVLLRLLLSFLILDDRRADVGVHVVPVPRNIYHILIRYSSWHFADGVADVNITIHRALIQLILLRSGSIIG